MQGKLISFTPLMVNNVHSTYAGQNGTLYKFVVTLESGGQEYKGTCNSSKQQPSWKIGEQYTFDHVVNGEYSNIKSLKPVESADYGGKFSGKKNDSSFVVQKCYEAALECSIQFFELNQDFYKSQEVEDQMTTALFNHIIKGDEQKRWMNISALRLTIAKLRANGAFNKDSYKTLSQWLLSTTDAIALSMAATVKQIVEQDKQNEQPK